MLSTENIGLKKPGYNDEADIAVINENSDIIDREFGNRYLKSETYSVEQANNAIAQAIEALPNGLVYHGAVNYYKDLPTANNKEGDTYSVKYQGETGTTADGNEYAWGKYDGTLQWIKLGVNAYTKNEIDEQHQEIKSDILNLENNKLNLNFGFAYVGSGATGWHRLAYCNYPLDSAYVFRDLTLFIEKGDTAQEEKEGILKFRVVTGTIGSILKTEIYALMNGGLTSNDIVMVAKVENNTLLAEIWCNITGTYAGYRATAISNTDRRNCVNFGEETYWILCQDEKPQENYPDWAHKATFSDYYAAKFKDLSDRITALENK